MKKKQEILVILSPGFAANEADTTCLPAQQQFVLTWRQEFPETAVVIISFQYPFDTKPFQWKGLSVIPLGGKNKGGIHRLIVWLRAWRQLSTLRKQYNIIGLLSFWCGESALVGKQFGKWYRVKYFAWLFGQDARKENNYIRLLRPQPHELIALSDSLVKEFEKNYRIAPSNVIPLGINPGLFTGGPPVRDIDILGVGSLIPLKQYDVFIETIAAIHQQHPFIKAVICGAGPEKEKLQNLIVKYGLSNTISLEGEKNHAAVLQLMQRSKILLHPSSYEGFSGACLEALYAGAHVISFVQPMNHPIEHWHTVQTREAMIAETKKILFSGSLDHSPILPYAMIDTVKKIHGLLAG